MSYLVLARKWRPRRFAELVGQEHVVRALSNALDSGRVHHAFLFTGTRGVGKTTIARIFAKSLNCERGIGAEPCGACAVCEAVDGGRFVDLLEIDAASNTGVDDVREVIENAQYMPTRGRYKVYLIDEVHMLSKNAFNALLKTLEEPPEHVKFLLATTDPQKLPVTVLSRCLQFNLRRLTLEQISAQMSAILAAEGVASDAGSIELLARGADGSLRDGLSLLDQALAFCGGALAETEVRAMLGSVDRSQVDALLGALAAGDGRALMDCAEAIAGFAPDFGSVLEDFAHALHRIQLRQLVPDIDVTDQRIDIAAHAASIAPDMVQLWYQMALNGRRDLALAPSPRVGFEMTLLRMLAFRPTGVADAPTAPARAAASERAPVAAPRSTATAARVQAPVPPGVTASPAAPAPLPADASRGIAQASAVAAPPQASASPAADRAPTGDLPAPALARAEAPHALADSDDWLDLLHQLALRGPLRELAANAGFVGLSGEVLRLALPDTLEHFRSEKLILQLASAVGDAVGRSLRIEFVTPRDDSAETLHDRSRRERSQRQGEAEVAFHADPAVQRLVGQYGARVQADSIRPVDER